MDLGLSGKVALVTGGSEGIGKATARALCQEGAQVVICARRDEVLQRSAREVVDGTRGEVLALAADVSRADDVQRVMDATVKRFGRLDALINNAGTANAAAFESVTDEAWQADLELKLFGAIRLSRLAIPLLRAAGGGSITNLLNIGSRQPAAGSTPSSVSRAAGLALTKALSKELGPDLIRVNAVLIGLVKSGQHDREWERHGGDRHAFYEAMAKKRQVPLGRVGEADEAASLIAFLVSDRAKYLTGAAINFDGGASAVP